MVSSLALLFFCAALTFSTITALADEPDAFEFGREKPRQTGSRRAQEIDETDM